MVEQVAFQTLFQFLQTVGILVGVYYYITTIRVSRMNQELQLETRQAQLFMQVFNRMQDIEFANHFNEIMLREWKDYDDWNRKYGRYTNPSAQAKSSSIGQFFEGLGVILKQGLIDIDIVGELMSRFVLLYWEKIRPIIMEMRERMNNPEVLLYAEYLYDELLKREERLGHDKELRDPYHKPESE